MVFTGWLVVAMNSLILMTIFPMDSVLKLTFNRSIWFPCMLEHLEIGTLELLCILEFLQLQIYNLLYLAYEIKWLLCILEFLQLQIYGLLAYYTWLRVYDSRSRDYSAFLRGCCSVFGGYYANLSALILRYPMLCMFSVWYMVAMHA